MLGRWEIIRMVNKLLIVVALCASFATAQQTPNLGLYTPPHGTQNWDVPYNNNWNLLDSFLSGSRPLPGRLTFTAGLTIADAYSNALATTSSAVTLAFNGGGSLVLGPAGTTGVAFSDDNGNALFIGSNATGTYENFNLANATTQSGIINTTGNTTYVYGSPMQIGVKTAGGPVPAAVSSGFSITSTNVAVVGPTFQLAAVLFAVLPACSSGTEGTQASVKDSSTNTWGATITGSSTNHVLAYCDGTNWTVAGK